MRPSRHTSAHSSVLEHPGNRKDSGSTPFERTTLIKEIHMKVIGLLGWNNNILYTPNGKYIGKVPFAKQIQAFWNKHIAFLRLRFW